MLANRKVLKRVFQRCSGITVLWRWITIRRRCWRRLRSLAPENCNSRQDPTHDSLDARSFELAYFNTPFWRNRWASSWGRARPDGARQHRVHAETAGLREWIDFTAGG